MKINILTDNRARKRGMLAEHGLSVLIEFENINILFDTGQSDVFFRNAKVMGIDLLKTDCIVLSHGHYDHCGGLIYFQESENYPSIYAHADLFTKKYAVKGGSCREIGIPWSLNDYKIIKDHMTFSGKFVEVYPKISLCAEIPSTQPFEGIPEGFYIEENNHKSLDSLKDEQMLVIEHEKGLVIFLGCSHPGVVSCLNYVLRMFPGKQIYALIAGMHLDNVSPLRLQMTIQHMINLDIQMVIPLHCTGIHAICEMKRFLGKQCFALCAGDSIEL